MRLVNRISTAILLVCVLSGCAQAGNRINKDEGAVTYDVGSPRSGDTAALSGVLAFNNGCVRLEEGPIPLFPEDVTSWDGETLVLSGVSYEMGDAIDVAGGEISRDKATVDVPDRCGTGTLFLVSPNQ
jgi:hypothetical protein